MYRKSEDVTDCEGCLRHHNTLDKIAEKDGEVKFKLPAHLMGTGCGCAAGGCG